MVFAMKIESNEQQKLTLGSMFSLVQDQELCLYTKVQGKSAKMEDTNYVRKYKLLANICSHPSQKEDLVLFRLNTCLASAGHLQPNIIINTEIGTESLESCQCSTKDPMPAKPRKYAYYDRFARLQSTDEPFLLLMDYLAGFVHAL